MTFCVDTGLRVALHCPDALCLMRAVKHDWSGFCQSVGVALCSIGSGYNGVGSRGGANT